MKILDLSAGRRGIWYNKEHALVTFLDKRPEVSPTFVCNTNAIPKEVGTGFNLICWDPPHANVGANSNMAHNYGHHTTKEILDTIEKTGLEAHRVSAPDAVMALKWNTHDISLQRVFDLLPKWEPLFGHNVKSAPRSSTFWTMLRRLP